MPGGFSLCTHFTERVSMENHSLGQFQFSKLPPRVLHIWNNFPGKVLLLKPPLRGFLFFKIPNIKDFLSENTPSQGFNFWRVFFLNYLPRKVLLLKPFHSRVSQPTWVLYFWSHAIEKVSHLKPPFREVPLLKWPQRISFLKQMLHFWNKP